MVRNKKLILASGSPHREALLKQAGYRFDLIVPSLGEPADKPAVSAKAWAESIAYFKARQVAEDYTDAAVIAADTIVVCRNEVIGKAENEEHAADMLDLLSHNRHCVITGVAIIDTSNDERLIDSSVSWITMKPMNRGEIYTYIASGAWKGKSGAYALQEEGDEFISNITGSKTNIIGLPMEIVPEMLKHFGISPARATQD